MTYVSRSPRVDPASPGDTVWRTFDHRPRLPHLVAIGHEHCAILGRCLASGHQLGQNADFAVGCTRAGFDQAHAAACYDGQAGMPAVMRNLDAGAPRGLNAVEPLVVGDFDFLSVDKNDGHEGKR